MTIGKDLTFKLQKLVLRVEDDLRTRLEEDPELKAKWQSEHADALRAERTSSAWVSWRDDRITQAAVGWVLTTVFLRFCEDNALLSKVWIAGPGARRQEAFDAENAYFRAHPENTWREWIMEGIAHLQSFPATAALVDEHAALWQISPSGAMAKEILDFWRATDEAGVPLYDFQDSELSTRFLGDLYQDLSEYAKKTFALLQTPEFVEEFILDHTLTPALAERPLEGFKLIDPTCGSGHFLLGGFQRLLDEWSAKAPNLDARERVQRALNAVHGVDLNPFAVAIARFRLTVAALNATGELDLERAAAFNIRLAAGDSLLHGHTQHELELGIVELDSFVSDFAYNTEDLRSLNQLLGSGTYDVVVGNPPYIQVQDKTLNRRYRNIYTSCKGTYALTVPFMERFFDLAKPGRGQTPSGWTGMITSNSFMRRSFGKKLVEEYLPSKDLTKVIDSEGAWIPGHNTDGTPTVIIVGRNRSPVKETVRVALSQGRRETRTMAAEGQRPYWSAIEHNIDQPGFKSEWIEVADLNRVELGRHPWSLAGGGASSLATHLSTIRQDIRSYLRAPIGGAIRSGADEAFVRPRSWKPALKVTQTQMYPFVVGDGVRDWTAAVESEIILPYVYGTKEAVDAGLSRELWQWRTTLSARATFQGNMADASRRWWEYMQYTVATYETPLSITFAEVASNNHFFLDRGGNIFKQTSPVLKLRPEATLETHYGLLGILNSSVSCFWLRRIAQPKGGAADITWLRTYQYSGKSVESLPVPDLLPAEITMKLDELAQELLESSPSQVVSALEISPADADLDQFKSKYESLRRRMISYQEELDWQSYYLYGLTSQPLTYTGDNMPEIRVGERAFELEMARRIPDAAAYSKWFSELGISPVSEVPQGWTADYQELVLRRMQEIDANSLIRALETPENKRRWAGKPWDEQMKRALGGWLLDKLEDRSFWFDAQGRPTSRSISQLADVVSRDSKVVGVLALWTGVVDVDIVKALNDLLAEECVPYLAAQRLKETGLRKREAWDDVWELQRREDAGEIVGRVPAPPEYVPADFRKTSWWQTRGKLDVPKERFILYPDAGRSTDPTLLLGWTGWDHVQQFLVLATIMDERISEGADDSQLVPLVAGMAEVLPWIRQWHADLDPTFGMSMADFCSAQLEERMTQLNASTTDLTAWRPAPAGRGRRAVKENA
ncbi:hypothetical protein ABIB17_003519 [Arthrobacter sp. UYEF6]